MNAADLSLLIRIFIRNADFADIVRDDQSVPGRVPDRNRLASRAGRESCSVRSGGTSRRVGGEREFTRLDHTEFQLAPRPSFDRCQRLARTIIIRMFFFKNRQDPSGLAGGLERQRPMHARIPRHGMLVFRFRDHSRFHEKLPQAASSLTSPSFLRREAMPPRCRSRRRAISFIATPSLNSATNSFSSRSVQRA